MLPRCLFLFTLPVVVGSASTAEDRTTPADEQRAWLASMPSAPKPELTKHGLAATELRRWRPRGANQGVAVDDRHFYG
ncbi:MAG: hypothetical protein RIR76_1396, partial [Verrucomicrobiota bacterium]